MVERREPPIGVADVVADLQRPAVVVDTEGALAERILLVPGAPLLRDFDLHAVRPDATPSEGPGVGINANHALDES
jgi:hypothetical protein